MINWLITGLSLVFMAIYDELSLSHVIGDCIKNWRKQLQTQDGCQTISWHLQRGMLKIELSKMGVNFQNTLLTVSFKFQGLWCQKDEIIKLCYVKTYHPYYLQL